MFFSVREHVETGPTAKSGMNQLSKQFGTVISVHTNQLAKKSLLMASILTGIGIDVHCWLLILMVIAV